MKKSIKINFRYFWGYFNPYDNFFTKLLKKDYNVIISDNPDYVFFSVYGEGRSPISSKHVGGIAKFIRDKFPVLYRTLKRIYYFKREMWSMPILKGNFVKIFYTGENCKPKMDKCDWAFSFVYDEKLKHPRHMRLPAYSFSFDSLNEFKKLIKKGMDVEKIKQEKIKFCNFIYTNHIPFRNRFFKKLCKYKKVESWGKCLNNMGKNIPKLMDENPKKALGKTIKYKPESILRPYKFIIAFENSRSVGYTTEKILEPMTVNSIPIYWGNPLIHRDFNAKSFINYHDFEKEVKERLPKFFFKIPIIGWLTEKYIREATFKKMIKRIKRIDNNDELYGEILKQPWYNDNKPPIYLDKERIRKRLKEIIESPRQIP